MNIEIKKNVSIELMLSQKIKFDLQMGRLYQRLFFPSLFGLIIIIANLNAKDGLVGNATGTCLTLLPAIYFYNIYNARKSFVNIAKKFVDKCEKNSKEIVIKINEVSFLHQTFETKSEYKWSAFSNYKLSNGILYLLINDSYLSSFGINENELKKQELVEFYTFLTKTIPEKK